MRIVFASDHAGFELKEYLKKVITEKGYTVVDVGAESYDPSDDYPEFIAKAAQIVSRDPEGTRGVILGRSGQGEAIVANRFPFVRAVVYTGVTPSHSDPEDQDMLTLTREHNDANVLSLGSYFLTRKDAIYAVLKWLETPFSGEERHLRRIRKIEEVTKHVSQ